jgi:hypothetical protein
MSRRRQRENRGPDFVAILLVIVGTALAYATGLPQALFDSPRFGQLRELPAEVASWFSSEPGSSGLRLPWRDRS